MSLAIIITNRLKELEISAKLLFTYHIQLDTQRMSFFSAKLLAIEIIYSDVLIVYLCLWNGITQL